MHVQMSRLNLDEIGKEKMKIFVNGRENEGSTIWRKRANVKGQHNAKVRFVVRLYKFTETEAEKPHAINGVFHKADLLPLSKLVITAEKSLIGRVYKSFFIFDATVS